MTEIAKRAVACKGWRWMPGMEFDATWNDATSTGWRIESVEHRYFSYWASEVVVIKASVCEFVISPRGNVHVRYAGKPLPDKSSGCRMLPDLTDPATRGCLLDLVREAWGRASGQPRRWSVDGWYWHADYNEQTVSGTRLYPSEVEALVAALEAAP